MAPSSPIIPYAMDHMAFVRARWHFDRGAAEG
jgi:hypothetical protein